MLHLWALKTSKGTGETLAWPPWLPGTVPRRLEGQRVLCPCVTPRTEQQPLPVYPSTASPGKEQVILGIIEPELIEFTFPTEREELPYDNEASAGS